jgi:hypothetical protein
VTSGRGDLVDAGSTNASDVLLVRSLLALTVVTGLIDAISFLGLGHIFTANMTGNVVFLAFAPGGAQGLSAIRSVTALKWPHGSPSSRKFRAPRTIATDRLPSRRRGGRSLPAPRL